MALSTKSRAKSTPRKTTASVRTRKQSLPEDAVPGPHTIGKRKPHPVSDRVQKLLDTSMSPEEAARIAISDIFARDISHYQGPYDFLIDYADED